MSDLSELLKTTKNIEKQNDEIIHLLKKIAGESEEDDKLSKYKKLLEYTPDFGELYIDDDKLGQTKEEPEEVENTFQIGTLLENSHDIGEVYFIEGENIFKLSIQNNETIINNITGDDEASEFGLQEMIANELIKNNASLDDSTVILNREQSLNLPETLKICVEQGAKKVYIPIFAATQLVGAPNSLMTILKLDFYKSEEELLEKLFN